ncbi:hypothetical protein GE21DRAFT_1221539 [Neurospora crassa]|nr:hypothetical protein GE21DRAFT_1221539 [Neurospora crassa]
MQARKSELLEEKLLVERLLIVNRTEESILIYREKARADNLGEKYLTVRDDLTLYNNKLIIPNTENLKTLAIKECYDTLLTAYLRRNKI